jgi:hypothetical protein
MVAFRCLHVCKANQCWLTVNITGLLPYILIVGLIGVIGFALTSRGLADRFIEMGILPQTLRGILPIVNVAVRAIGFLLVICGLTKLALDAGWLNAAILQRYGLAILLILIGTGFLILSWKNQRSSKLK